MKITIDIDDIMKNDKRIPKEIIEHLNIMQREFEQKLNDKTEFINNQYEDRLNGMINAVYVIKEWITKHYDV